MLEGEYAGSMQVLTIPCLQDNYAYLLVCEKTKQAAVVDPAEAGPVLKEIKAQGVTVQAIWNTHHHPDHVGGNEEILKAFPGAEVVGHSSDKGRIPGQGRFVDHGDVVSVGEEISASIVYNPGHTRGAISYYVKDGGVVFTGDTLFAAGCGRLFEGSAADMQTSFEKLGALPGDTKIYCGHEYTQSNLRFASAVEPNNQALAARVKAVDALRAADLPSMGFTIAQEHATNPFMRTADAAVMEKAVSEVPAADGSPAAIFASLRSWKDRF